ncbi:MAG: hypothetical protein ABI151_16505 [Chitinophagaceae bacterium]
MFTSKKFLIDRFDVNPTIAAFFVDRKVPVDNRYWHNRLLYVSGGTGFLFIPLYIDLQFRCGVPLIILLDEAYIKLTELILHHAAIHEAEEADMEAHIAFCQAAVQANMKHPKLFEDLTAYYQGQQTKHKYLGTGIRALNRADTLLFALCTLQADEQTILQIIECWYALVPSFLLIDDIVDLEADKEMKQENSVLEFGAGAKGINAAINFLNQNITILGRYNKNIQMLFANMLNKKLVTTYIKSILDS